GVLIGRRRNVHGDTGIRVPVPRAADIVTRLDDEVVAESLLVELDRGADAGESRADDQAVVVGLLVVHRYLPREPLVDTDGTAYLAQCRFQGGQTAVGRLGGGRDYQRDADVAVHQGALVAQFDGHAGGVEQPRVKGGVVAQRVVLRAADEGGGQPGEILGVARRQEGG